MAIRWYSTVIDCRDVAAQGAWWARAQVVKNRLHLDLAPWGEDDHATELERLLDLGATRADIGQEGVPWVVLADPEGNEFCLLPPRDR